MKDANEKTMRKKEAKRKRKKMANKLKKTKKQRPNNKSDVIKLARLQIKEKKLKKLS